VEIRREFFFGPRDGHHAIGPNQAANENPLADVFFVRTEIPCLFPELTVPHFGVMGGSSPWEFQDCAINT